MKIRIETSAEHQLVHNIHNAAFGQEDEGLLVEALRQSEAFVPELSLVAADYGLIVGHILFTRINIVAEDGTEHQSLALAPMGVMPDHQKKGVGKLLLEEGLNTARMLGYDSVIVLGHADYYSKFGFEPAENYDIKAPKEVPSESFMALELNPGALDEVSGVVKYDEAFGI